MQQYYYVNQGPTYTGPGNWAPRPVYQETSVSYGNSYYGGYRARPYYGARYGVGYGGGYRYGVRPGLRYGYGARVGYGARRRLRRACRSTARVRLRHASWRLPWRSARAVVATLLISGLS